MPDKFDIMLIAAHPDDAEFSSAGTIARLASEGKKIIYVVCTNGDKGTSDRSIKPEELATLREKEQVAAAKTLGVNDVVFLRYPDQSLEDTPEFRKNLVRQIRTYRPDIILSADPYRRYIWHRDHRICGQVVLDAVFPFARDHLSYPDLLAEGLEPFKVAHVWMWGNDQPNFRSDITDYFDIKVAALRCHKSQVGETPRPEVMGWLRTRAETAAQGTNYKLAEAFFCVDLPP